VHGHRTDAGGTVGSSPADSRHPTWRFLVRSVSGYTVTRNEFAVVARTGTEEGASITATAGRVTGYLTVLSPHFPGYPTGSAGTPISVNGNPGFFVAGQHVDGADVVASVYRDPWRAVAVDADHQPRLFWRYPDGSWARIEGTFGFRSATYDFDNGAAKAAMLRIARAVRRADEPVRLPFSVMTPPRGLYLESVHLGHGVPCAGYGYPVPSGTGAIDREALVCRVPTGATREQTVRNARLGDSSSEVLVRDLPDGSSVLVTYPGGGDDRFGHNDAARVLRDVDATPSPGDVSTWLPAG
jgi:hypothetical protein